MCEGGPEWIYDTFGECIITVTDKISFGFGTVSNFIWVICTTPQIYRNWKTKDVAGQSAVLFSFLFLGSVLNAIGCIVTHGLLNQILAGVIYVLTCGIAFGQFWWYGHIKPRCTGKNTRGGVNMEMRGPGIIGGLAVMAQVGAATDWIGPYQSDKLIGTVFGWAGMVILIASRLPQIAKNIKNKKVSNLSPVFVALSIMGNVTFSASLIIKSIDTSYLWRQAPFLFTSFGSMSCDMILALQMMVYGIGVSRPERDDRLLVAAANRYNDDVLGLGRDGEPTSELMSEM